MTTRILLTGAAGGIGRATAVAFAREGAHIALVDRDAQGLETTAAAVREAGGTPSVHVTDLSDLERAAAVVSEAERELGQIDVLINNAGLISFTPFEQEDPVALDRLMRVNVTAPMTLVRAALPAMQARGSGRIVNVGSIFGSIGFAWFAAYSASKFAMRGFSESLRRELAGTGVQVTYVAPRATRTPLATVFGRMAEATKMTMDPPETVAGRIVRAVGRGQRDVYVGFPECLFVRINGLLPRFVDKALRKQDAVARPFALEAAEARRASAPAASRPAAALHDAEATRKSPAA